MERAHAPEAPARVVIVEDDEGLRTALTFSLDVEGYSTIAFASGEALLETPPADGCACLIIDYILPGMSGLDLLDALRAQGTYAPAALITSSPKAEVRARARRSGVPIIEKPLLADTMTTLIGTLIGDAFAAD